MPALYARRLLLSVVLIILSLILTNTMLRFLTSSAMQARAIYDAEQNLLWSMKLRPWNKQLLVDYARCARWRGDLQEWRERLDAAANAAPMASQWKQEQQLGEIQGGKMQADPQRQLDQLLAGGADPDDVAEAFTLGYLVQGDADRAQDVLRAWEAGSLARMGYLRGRIAQYNQERGQARRAYTDFLATAPRHEPARFALADILLEEDRIDEAWTHYEHLYRATRGDLPARLGLARCLRLSGQPEQGLSLLEYVETEGPSAKALYMARGQLALE